MQKICVIIPCYNEEKRLDTRALKAYLSANPNVFFLGVNDGSRDATAELLKELNLEFQEQFQFLNLPQNAGKAEAVRQGMLKAARNEQFDYIGYWDADFSTPLHEINHFVEFSGGQLTHALIMGSRIARLGSNIKRKPHRHYLGRIFSTLTSQMLDLKVYDTQCGAKLIARDYIDALLTEPFVSKWFFDVEILARLIKSYGRDKTYKMVLEIPLLEWHEIGGSKLKTIDFIKVPLELLKIKRFYKI